MIALLRGQLVDRDGTRGVLDVRDVGYEVFAPRATLDAWAEVDGEVVVHVSTQVREDAITLYGFANPLDRKAFIAMLSVSGVGPRLALACLDTLSLSALAQAVAGGDVRALSKIPGVGKKTAQRLALELKDKLPAAPLGTPRASVPSAPVPVDPLPLALARLGYRKSEIDQARSVLAAQGLAEDAPVSDRLRAALQVLSGS